MKNRMWLKIGTTAFLINLIYAHSYISSPTALSMLDLSVSLVERGALDIDPYAGNTVDVAIRGDHYYSGLAPGVSLLGVPFYAALKPVLDRVATPERERKIDEKFLAAKVSWRPSEGRLRLLVLNFAIVVLGCSALAAAAAVLFHHALGLVYPDLDPGRRLRTTWLFCFGTLFFYYTPALEHRVLSTLLSFGALVAVLEPGPARARRGLLFGAALAYAAATTYEVALVAAGVGIYAIARRGRDWPWLWSIVGAAGVAIPLAAYHQACFGSPLATPYGHRLFAESAPAAFMAPLSESSRTALAEAGARAFSLLLGNKYGLIFFSPPLILAFAAAFHLGRPGAPRGLAALAYGVTLVLLSLHFFTGYQGTPGEYGFRFMLPVLPLLMLLAPLTYGWSYRLAVPVLGALGLTVVGFGLMWGVNAKSIFEGDGIAALVRHYGLSNYTLANLKDHVRPGLNPLLISAAHLGALALLLLALRRFVWRTPNPSAAALEAA